METISCLVIDDEPLARKGLKEYIADVDFLKYEGEFDDPLKAAQVLSTSRIQLLFLDIQMPKITGVELMKSLVHPPPVIFTTAFTEFALESYDLNALDYLVKPISFERFFKAALKAKEYYELRRTNSVETDSSVGEQKNYFFIKADNKLVKLFFDEILFVEALQNYVSIQTTTKKYISYLTFKSIAEYLPPTFIKCHKSYLVSGSKISSIEANDIMIGNFQIPISHGNKEEVIEKLVKGKFLKR